MVDNMWHVVLSHQALKEIYQQMSAEGISEEDQKNLQTLAEIYQQV